MALVRKARSLEPEKRGAYLEEVCGDDGVLRKEVESLLEGEAGSRDSSFESDPSPVTLGGYTTGQLSSAPSSDGSGSESSAGLSSERALAGEDLNGKNVGRFVVRARLGAGGMGEVYLADDTKLRRLVALKRLAPRLRANESYRRRFLAEGQHASGLSDAHIASVYDVLEDQDETFLVMEYIEGITLRQRLAEEISVDEFLKIAQECAEALVTAHEKGIIHRDIKPDNIMMTTKGGLKILDFGVAKRLPYSDQIFTAETLELAPHEMVGTPSYMAPEVIRGTEPDGRADIFSLGVVSYEVLTGRNPFLAETFLGTSDNVLHKVPEPIRKFNPKVPEAVERIVGKMLVKDVAERYRDAPELLRDLQAAQKRITEAGQKPFRKRLIAASVVLLVLLSATMVGSFVVGLVSPEFRWQLEKLLQITVVPGNKQLAVLPFDAVGGDAQEVAFANGLSETLSVRLTRLTDKHPLQVIAASVARAKGVTTLPDARREFGVNLGLEGSLRRAGDIMRVTYSVVDANTLRQLRGDTITARALNPFALEDQVADSVISALEIELQPQEKRAQAVHGTVEPAAYDYFLQGRGYLQDYQKPQNIENAITVLNRALERDPNYSLAFAGLGEAFWHKYALSKDVEWVKRARTACEHAVALNADEASAHACLGLVFTGTGKYELAADEYRRAGELEPTSDDAVRGLAMAYESLGKTAEAEETYHKAIALRPQYWRNYNFLGGFYFSQGRYADAARMFQVVVSISPDSFYGYSNLGATYIGLGRYAEAVPVLERSMSILPTADCTSNLATAHFYLGDFKAAARTSEEALRRFPRNQMIWGNLADAYYWAAGTRSRAPDAFRKAATLAKDELQVNPHNANTLSYLAYYQAMLGESGEALSSLQQALRDSTLDPEILFNAALVHNQLGNVDQSLTWLERARAAGLSPARLGHTPNFENLRANPRFQALLKSPR